MFRERNKGYNISSLNMNEMKNNSNLIYDPNFIYLKNELKF